MVQTIERISRSIHQWRLDRAANRYWRNGGSRNLSRYERLRGAPLYGDITEEDVQRERGRQQFTK